MPAHGAAQVAAEGITWNYTTVLNLIAFALTAALLVRFVRTGGRGMLSMMGGGPEDGGDGEHAHHHVSSAEGHEAHGHADHEGHNAQDSPGSHP